METRPGLMGVLVGFESEASIPESLPARSVNCSASFIEQIEQYNRSLLVAYRNEQAFKQRIDDLKFDSRISTELVKWLTEPLQSGTVEPVPKYYRTG